MLLERNQVIIGAIAAVVLVAGTFFAVVLSGGLIKRGMEMEAVFTDAAGLKPRSFVFVAGVRSGQVQEVSIDGDTVRATFTLTAPAIPNDSTASIIPQNTLGKRAIRIQPGVSDEFFEAGDVIPVERTSTPIDLPE
ncbi:MAG: MlaD family protein, partial [Nitriliruptorales bacterium]|nr:MlaD family protein [Nitriliruptorales bacterium]